MMLDLRGSIDLVVSPPYQRVSTLEAPWKHLGSNLEAPCKHLEALSGRKQQVLLDLRGSIDLVVSPPYQLHDSARELRPSHVLISYTYYALHTHAFYRTRHSKHPSQSAYFDLLLAMMWSNQIAIVAQQPPHLLGT